VALGALAVVGWRLFGRAHALRTALEHDEAAFAARGFVEIAANDLSGAGSFELEAPAASCFLALSTSGAVTIRSGASSSTAERSLGWCACAAERVAVTSVTPGGGLAVMRIDARVLGGPLARPWLSLAPQAWAPGGEACADGTLDDWIADRRFSQAPVDVVWFDGNPGRESLRRAGFRVVSGVEPGRPFGVVEATADACFLAVAKEADVLSLRGMGGGRRIAGARGALAWCKEASETLTVWRDGASEVVVLSASAGRVGGVLGTRECAEIAGLRVAAESTWLSDDDLAWNAASLLRASTIPELQARALPLEPGLADSRLAAVATTGGPGATSLARQPAGAVLACDPPLDALATERVALCASTEPVSWWRSSDVPAAAARGPMPFWLSLLEPRREPDAVARIPELLSLARRLARVGFTPSVLEGVTELADGVRVVGRAGEDAVVAVGLGPRAPWAFPFTNGVAWDLGDAPRVVELAPGSAVRLVSYPPPNSPIDKRRTVVFRRAVSR
jgi:hypothetical protein